MEQKSKIYFLKARPIWMDCDEADLLNNRLLFEFEVNVKSDSCLYLSAIDFYRLKINDRFVGFGPARAARGYARVDVYKLSEYCNESIARITIEVAGYYCKSLSTCRQKPMLIAEVRDGNDVVIATGSSNIKCCKLPEHERIVERYTVQRHFGESYDYSKETREYIKTVENNSNITFLDRGVGVPDYSEVNLDKSSNRGTFYFDDNLEKARANAWSYNPYNQSNYGVFPREVIKDRFYRYVTHTVPTITGKSEMLPVNISNNQFVRFDFRYIEVGFIKCRIIAKSDSDVVIGFSENSQEAGVSFATMNAQNVIALKIPQGKCVDFESFEPYTCKSIAFFVRSGQIELSYVGIRRFQNDMSKVIKHEYLDDNINKVYTAALRTFSHNSVDIYTDCPSRERAGWLCDSYFTSKAEFFFFGKSTVERNFLENYCLFDNAEGYIDGVLPMVYPSDAKDGNEFIPQWNLWFVLEAKEYVIDRNNESDREMIVNTVKPIMKFFEKHENEYGLLEKLPSWNFVEWSDANKWTMDVNYPTNFLYSAAIDAYANLVGDNSLHEKANRVRSTTKEMSFDGEVFVDHAYRNSDNVLVNFGDVSEACQYYACLFGDVDINDSRYNKLKAYIENHFKDYTKPLCSINAFIGLYLRMDLLDKLGWTDILVNDINEFFLHMVDITGTLWEYRDMNIGSLDHGFASYIATLLPKQ